MVNSKAEPANVDAGQYRCRLEQTNYVAGQNRQAKASQDQNHDMDRTMQLDTGARCGHLSADRGHVTETWRQGCGVGVGITRSRGNEQGLGVGDRVDQTASAPTPERFA